MLGIACNNWSKNIKCNYFKNHKCTVQIKFIIKYACMFFIECLWPIFIRKPP